VFTLLEVLKNDVEKKPINKVNYKPKRDGDCSKGRTKQPFTFVQILKVHKAKIHNS
jgi:hypothetical protein